MYLIQFVNLNVLLTGSNMLTERLHILYMGFVFLSTFFLNGAFGPVGAFGISILIIGLNSAFFKMLRIYTYPIITSVHDNVIGRQRFVVIHCIHHSV